MRYTALATLALLSLAAHAQTMKPGLWEIKQQPQLDAKRQAQLDEARKQMAKMMKMAGSGKMPQLPGMAAGAPTIAGSKPKPSATRKASSKRKKKKARR